MRSAKRIGMWSLALLLLCGCGKVQGNDQDLARAMKAQEAYKAEDPVIGLILSSRDAEENEELISSFQKETDAVGARLLIRIPEVSEEDAKKALALTGSFVLCNVDPIEYQMLFVDEMVAEDVDVIAIRANHGEALEPVLSAARAVGIQVCVFGCQVTEGSYDLCVEMEDAASAAMGLLQE